MLQLIAALRNTAAQSENETSGLLGILAANAKRRLPVDETLLKELGQRLATVPFGPPNKNSLVGAVRDIGSGYFAVNAEIVDRLYRAALSNPRLVGDHRSQIVAEFGNLPPEIRPKAEPSKEENQ